MKTHEELITLIGNMFTDAYVAGDRKDLDSFRVAKAQREELFAAVKDLYEEIADRSIRINDLLHELHRYREEEYHRTHAKLNMAEFYGKKISHVDDRSLYPASKPEEEVPDHHDAFDSMFPGCTPDDLPFPDVDDLAPAEEVEGSDVVAGFTPATAEASADAEGEGGVTDED